MSREGGERAPPEAGHAATLVPGGGGADTASPKPGDGGDATLTPAPKPGDSDGATLTPAPKPKPGDSGGEDEGYLAIAHGSIGWAMRDAIACSAYLLCGALVAPGLLEAPAWMNPLQWWCGALVLGTLMLYLVRRSLPAIQVILSPRPFLAASPEGVLVRYYREHAGSGWLWHSVVDELVPWRKVEDIQVAYAQGSRSGNQGTGAYGQVVAFVCITVKARRGRRTLSMPGQQFQEHADAVAAALREACPRRLPPPRG